jgi:anionic cell wall polymer biosynthesis LytR-Cps2A-Psr (LCP) family protein
MNERKRAEARASKRERPSEMAREAVRRAVFALSAFTVLTVGMSLLARLWREHRVPPEEPYAVSTPRATEALTRVRDGETYRLKDQLTTLLLIGVDRPSIHEPGGRGYQSGGQADYLLLLVVDDEAQTVSRLQIDRDTMAQIETLGITGHSTGVRTAQICLSYSFGDGREQSAQRTKDAVGKLLGVPIDGYVAIGIDGIGALNAMAGGVTVTLEDDYSAYDPAMVPGATLKLTDAQAELVARFRVDVGDGTNASRMRRQNAYLSALTSALTLRADAEQGFLAACAEELEKFAITDVGRGRMVTTLRRAMKYARGETLHPPGSYTVGVDGFVEFHADARGLEEQVLILWYEPIQ